MAVSNTETIGFGNQLVQLMQDHAAILKDGGLDVAIWITETTAQRDAAVVEGGKQDEMQAALKVQTKKSKDAHTLLYKSGSSKLDAIMGVLGKTSAAAKQAGKLRSSIIKQAKSKSSPKK